MENTAQEQIDRRLGKIFIIGFLSLVCLISLTCLATFATIYRNNIPIVKNYFPTPAPTSTPLPRFVAHPPSNDIQVLKDDFTTNSNNWSIYYDLSKAEVKDGKLALESFDSNSIAITHCFCKALTDKTFANRYYLQADLSTDNPTRAVYGLVFSLSDKSTYYTFTISASRGTYYLAKKLEDGWVSLYSGADEAIKSYPDVNTLSVYIAHGSIELYVNGKQLTTYEDKQPLTQGQVGMISEGINFKLIVDNLFAYNDK